LCPAEVPSSGAPAEGPLRAIQRVLLVDPDDRSRRSLHLLLDRRGLAVSAVASTADARRWLGEAACDVLVVEADLVGGLVRDTGPPVIAVAGAGDVDVGLRALDAGAADCLIGTPDEVALAMALYRVARGARGEVVVPPVPGDPAALDRLVGDSSAMRGLRETLIRLAPHRSTVLITGESGTGKELVAHAIHDLSPRAARRFVAINCAAIPGPLLESELFGHRKGSFTDAIRDKPGLFEDATGGTLFLDEVGELPLALQVKLLRALQESEIRRVGDTQSITVDVRLIAATNRDLTAEVRAGRFREDLFYRLNVLPVLIPPLRDRPTDIPPLVDHFVERHRARHGRGARLAPDALEVLSRQGWPGNVRELENTVERVLVLAEGPVVDAAMLADHLRPVRDLAGGAGAPDGAELSIKKATRALEIELIRRALTATGGNRTTAARLLEISHRALLYKIKDYGIP
jgi:two-component system, NtrC family, response regulator AtoC